MNEVYGEINRATGCLGGAIPDASLYGEIRKASFHRCLTFLISRCGLAKKGKSFLDIGSGLGKPSLHVAVDSRLPHLSLSFGIEVWF